MSVPSGSAPGAPTSEELLEAYVASQIDERRARGEAISDEAAEEIQAKVAQMTKDNTLGKIKELAADENVRGDFQKINFLNGLPGAMAMIKALLGAANLSEKRTKRVLRLLKLPWAAKPDYCGGLTLTFPRPGGGPVEYHLHGGECSANHDFGAEFAKVEAAANEKDLQRIRDQCSMIVFFTRQAYMEILSKNAELFEKEVIPRLDGAKIVEGNDAANSTIYLQKSGEGPLEPRVGLFFTLKE